MADRQLNSNDVHDEDAVRNRRTVGVYDRDHVEADEVTVTSPNAPTTTDADVRAAPANEPRTAPRPGPTTDKTTETRRAGGVPLVTWVAIAIVAIIILWLVFTFVI